MVPRAGSFNPIVTAARRLLADEGLALPPLPPALAAELKMLGQWQFGTRTEAPPLYDFEGHLAELERADLEDYVHFGHAGHGAASYAFHYYLSYGSIGVAVQLDWGGAFTDHESATQRVGRALASVELLVETSERQPDPGTTARLIAAVSDHANDALFWIRDGAESRREQLPLPSGADALASAAAALIAGDQGR